MMPFDFQTHIPVKGGAEHEVRAHPYIQITGRDGSILLRDGKFWSNDGAEVAEADVPQWVLDEVDKLTPAGRESVGFHDAKPAPVVAKGPAAPPPKAPSK